MIKNVPSSGAQIGMNARIKAAPGAAAQLTKIVVAMLASINPGKAMEM